MAGAFNFNERSNADKMRQKYTQDQVANICRNYGFIQQEYYHGVNIPMMCTCSCGAATNISLSSILKGQKCFTCGNNTQAKKNRLSQDYVTKQFVSRGYQLQDNYVNNDTKMWVQHLSCHYLFQITYSSFQQGCGCPLCGKIQAGTKHSGSQHPKWIIDREKVKQMLFWQRKVTQILHGCLNRVGTTKQNHTDVLLGYSPNELRQHIESFDTFNTLSKGNWHIDHIFPLRAFLDHEICDISLICALDNLQPLSVFDNISKGCTYSESAFLCWLNRHGIKVDSVRKENPHAGNSSSVGRVADPGSRGSR